MPAGGRCTPGVIPGHEFVGEVVQLGDGSAELYGLAVGDQVCIGLPSFTMSYNSMCILLDTRINGVEHIQACCGSAMTR